MIVSIRRVARYASLARFYLTFLAFGLESLGMESYLRIRNILFLVSFWKRASFHYACRPSRPGKNYGAPFGDALIFTLSWTPYHLFVHEAADAALGSFGKGLKAQLVSVYG